MRISKRVAIFSAVALSATTLLLWAQEHPVFRLKVDMVVMSFTVTDSKTGDVIRKIPTDEALAITHAIDNELRGNLINQKA